MRATILGMCLALGLAAGAAHAADATFKDWWVACDNVRECAAYGFSPEDSDSRPYLKLTRGAGAADAPRVEVVGQMGASSWRLQVDGKPVAGIPTLARDEDRLFLNPAQSAALVRAIANGATLEVVAGEETAPISLSGSSAALRWMDDQQKRAGTLGALVAKGPKPATVPPAPPLPLVRAAAPVSQKGLPTKLPKSVLALMTECEAGIGERMETEPVIARLSPGVILYAPLCYTGAYNFVHTFIVTDEQGKGARPLSIQYENGSPTSELMNIHFDPARQALSNFEKGRGVGDCGGVNAWVWTGKAFEVVEEMRMGECRGVGAEDWPITYRSRPE